MSPRSKRAGAPRHFRMPLIVLTLCISACQQDNDSTVAHATDLSVADAQGDTVPLETYVSEDSTSSVTSPVSGDDPFASFGYGRPKIADASKPHRIAVRLVNRATEDAIVRADAGAGVVPVDTIPAGDSLLVNLETVGDSILLSGVSGSGVSLGSRWIRTDSDADRVVFP